MTVPTTPCGTLLRMAAGYAPAGLGDLVAQDGAVLVIAPHPDDETLGCGAAIMDALSNGRSVGIVLLTDGCASHPNSTRYDPKALAALRRREFAHAVETLREAGKPLRHNGDAPDLQTVRFGLPDTAVPDAAEASPVIDAITRFAERIDARTLWCTWRGDPHCDHQAAASIADAVADRCRVGGTPLLRCDYAVWGRFGDNGTPLDGDLLSFPHGRHGPSKAKAMAQYASQLTRLIDDDPAGFMMPPAITAHFAAHPEIFIKPQTVFR